MTEAKTEKVKVDKIQYQVGKTNLPICRVVEGEVLRYRTKPDFGRVYLVWDKYTLGTARPVEEGEEGIIEGVKFIFITGFPLRKMVDYGVTQESMLESLGFPIELPKGRDLYKETEPPEEKEVPEVKRKKKSKKGKK